MAPAMTETHQPAPSLVELGQRLSEERVRRGWTLQQVVDRSRIPLGHLIAIEAGNYSSIPAEVYMRGFVRSYAKLLDLDEETMLQALDKAGILSAATTVRMAPRGLAVKVVARTKTPWGWLQLAPRYWFMVGAVVLGGVLVGLGIRGITSLMRKVESRPIPPSPFQGAPAPSRPLKSWPGTGAALVLSPIVVSVTAYEGCWIEFQVDDRRAGETTIQAGESRVWSGSSRVRLLLGNAGGVKVSGPKGPVSLPDKPGRVVHLLFNPYGVTRLKVPEAQLASLREVQISSTQIRTPQASSTQMSPLKSSSTATSP